MIDFFLKLNSQQIFLICLCVFLFVLIIIQIALIAGLPEKFKQTKAVFLKRAGYLVFVQGVVGIGKTSLCCGLTNIVAEKLEEEALYKLSQTRMLCAPLDFIAIDKLIDDLMEKGQSDKQICSAVDAIEELYFSRNKIYDFMMKESTSCYPLLEEYVQAYRAVKRKSYVYFQGRFKQVRKNYLSTPFSHSDMNIKDRFEEKNFNLKPYFVIFEDDSQTKTLPSTYSRKFSEADGGSALFMRTIRHIFKGKMYLITNSQRYMSIVAPERNLATSIFFVEGNKRIETLFIPILFFKLVRSIFNYFFDITRNFTKYQGGIGKKFIVTEYETRKKKNFLKPTIRKINSIIDELQTKDYLRIDATIYFSVDDVGKKSPAYGSLPVKLYFPIRYCYGSTKQYLYSSLYDDLISGSATGENAEMLKRDYDRLPEKKERKKRGKYKKKAKGQKEDQKQN